MSWFGFGAKENKPAYRERDLKAHLKSGLIRLNLRKNKATAAVQKGRRDIGTLLKNGDDEKARIIVEQTLQEENQVEAFEELQGICEEVSARIGIITASKRLPIELKEPICTLIWVSARISIKEFGLIRQQFALRFGANLDHEALCNIENCVSESIIRLLSPMPPNDKLVFGYLKTIAESYNIDWDYNEDDNEEDDIDESALLDIYGSAAVGNDNNNFKEDCFDLNNLPDIVNNSSISLENDIIEDDNLDDLESFENMFAAIPEHGIPDPGVKPVIRSNESSGYLGNAPIQKVISIKPQSVVQNIKTVSSVNTTQQPQKIKKITPSNTQNIELVKAPSSPLKVQVNKELAELSNKELEDEFEQLFNCTFDDTKETKSETNTISSISLDKEPEVTINIKKPEIEIVEKEAEVVEELISTTESTEYDDLFSSEPVSNNMGQISMEFNESGIDNEVVNDDEYESVFNRLHSISNENTSNISLEKEDGIDIIDEEMSTAEWEARFNSGSSIYQFDTTPIEPTPIIHTPIKEENTNPNQSEIDADELMKRFRAL